MNLELVKAFVRVAQLSSFTRAAEQLGLPKSRVSTRVKALEAELGSTLLQRTSRSVVLTPDGEAFLPRALDLIEQAERLASMFRSGAGLRGRVRLDLPVTIARTMVIPRLPELLLAHPQLQLVISATDRHVSVLREGFDLVLRIGKVRGEGLVVKRLGSLAMVNCVSPSYVARHGLPAALADLPSHYVVNYSTTLGDEPSFEHWDGATWQSCPMQSMLTVNSTDALMAACVAGLGIAQFPRYGAEPRLRDGALLEVLPDHTCAALPVSLVHGHGRNVPKRVRAVMTWLAEVVQVS